MICCCFRHGGGGAERSGVPFNEVGPYRYSDRRRDGKLHRAAKVVGRDDDRDRVKDLLIGTDAGKEVAAAVACILGIGGLGKTTLARYVYNDREVARHFGLRAWYLVTEDPNMNGLAKAVIRSSGAAGGGEDDGLISDELLQFAVTGRRLLLVLDDVWDEGVRDLNRFIALLQGSSSGGSRILVTTRSEGVVAGLGGGPVHRLEGLSSADCWELFRQKAFGAVREETPQLETIGREIVEKCHGVPLVVLAVGGILRSETDRSVWTNVRDSEVWELPEVASHTLSALKLSYDHLPAHLKRCFEYCSLLPKAYDIDRGKLADLWAAEGFVAPPPADDGVRPDAVAGGCFDDLLQRSFFEEDADSYEEHWTISYRMHDLFHDLARSVVGGEHWTAKAEKDGRMPKECRRLALVCGFMSPAVVVSQTPSEPKRLETLVFLMEHPLIPSAPRCAIVEIPNSIFSGLRNLRRLDVSSTGITELPRSIGKLSRLLHLDASETQIDALPPFIGGLRRLQTLNLKLCTRLQALPSSIKNLLHLAVLNLDGCKSLRELPEGICKMRGLVHLLISGCLSLSRMPPELGKLINLRTLPVFVVNEDEGCSISELRHLKLCDEIHIKNLGKLRDPVASGRAALREKPGLRRLDLEWNEKGYGDDKADVLDGLQPHPNLKELEMRFYGGTEFPRWMAPATIAASLPNVVEITLGGLGKCNRLPALGLLPSLRRLKLMSLDAVRRLGEEFYGETGTFPALEELSASVMTVWEEWPPAGDGRAIFPRLTTVDLMLCTRLTSLPRLPAAESLVLMWGSAAVLSEQSLGGDVLPRLKKLHVCRSAGPSSTWDGLRHLTAVEELSVESFEGSVLPAGVGCLPSLKRLTLSACPNLAALPEAMDASTALQSLELKDCPELTSLSDRLRRLVVAEEEYSGWRK